MRLKEWTVVECPTEADHQIALECKDGDSDMLVYENIRTIWQPISRMRLLVYDKGGILATLGLNRIQLTVLNIGIQKRLQ